MAAVEQVAPLDRLAAAVATVKMLAPADGDDDGAWREELVKRFGVVRQFLSLLAQVVPLLRPAPVRSCSIHCASCLR